MFQQVKGIPMGGNCSPVSSKETARTIFKLFVITDLQDPEQMLNHYTTESGPTENDVRSVNVPTDLGEKLLGLINNI